MAFTTLLLNGCRVRKISSTSLLFSATELPFHGDSLFPLVIRSYSPLPTICHQNCNLKKIRIEIYGITGYFLATEKAPFLSDQHSFLPHAALSKGLHYSRVHPKDSHQPCTENTTTERQPFGQAQQVGERLTRCTPSKRCSRAETSTPGSRCGQPGAPAVPWSC